MNTVFKVARDRQVRCPEHLSALHFRFGADENWAMLQVGDGLLRGGDVGVKVERSTPATLSQLFHLGDAVEAPVSDNIATGKPGVVTDSELGDHTGAVVHFGSERNRLTEVVFFLCDGREFPVHHRDANTSIWVRFQALAGVNIDERCSAHTDFTGCDLVADLGKAVQKITDLFHVLNRQLVKNEGRGSHLIHSYVDFIGDTERVVECSRCERRGDCRDVDLLGDSLGAGDVDATARSAHADRKILFIHIFLVYVLLDGCR